MIHSKFNSPSLHYELLFSFLLVKSNDEESLMCLSKPSIIGIIVISAFSPKTQSCTGETYILQPTQYHILNIAPQDGADQLQLWTQLSLSFLQMKVQEHGNLLFMACCVEEQTPQKNCGTNMQLQHLLQVQVVSCQNRWPKDSSGTCFLVGHKLHLHQVPLFDVC